MVITNRDAVAAGTRLTASYKKQSYFCTVEAGTDGKLAFMYDGKSYNSPSSAGAAVMGTACNGWRFWSIEGEAPAATASPVTKAQRGPKASTRKATTRKVRTPKPKQTILHRHDNQTDLSEGETRWMCKACLKNFTVFGNETPSACPEGHSNDDSVLNEALAVAEVGAAEVEAVAE